MFNWTTDHTSIGITNGNFTKVCETIHEDSHKTIHNIFKVEGLSYGTCQWILLEKLKIHHTAAKFVPCLLTVSQEEHWIHCVQEAQRMLQKWSILNFYWWWNMCYRFNPETKQQSSHEVTKFTKTEKSVLSLFQHKIKVDFFLCQMHFLQRICSWVD